MSEQNEQPVINPDLLEILRCPVAVRSKEYGDDPGKLEVVHNSWLVCADSGLKYPIRDGIPVMLIEEGEKWKDTNINDLPVPPPSANA
ncbi:MAG: Trm112 family protein [Chloroflexota bacterium]